MAYNADAVRAYFDDFADKEWSRLEATVQARSSYAIHHRILSRYAQPTMRVLDIGSGPGRFAIDLARAGCRVTLGDISPIQLDLARQQIQKAGLLERVDDFRQIDVTDLAALADDAFDLVVCFGGPLSYACERYPDGLREMARVVCPGGAVLVSVMSLWGTLRLAGTLDMPALLTALSEHVDLPAVFAGDDVVLTVPTSKEFHRPLALFTASGLRTSMTQAGLDVEVMASSNPLVDVYQRIPQIAESGDAVAVLQQLELVACERSGLLDTGSHLIAVGRRGATAF